MIYCSFGIINVFIDCAMFWSGLFVMIIEYPLHNNIQSDQLFRKAERHKMWSNKKLFEKAKIHKVWANPQYNKIHQCKLCNEKKYSTYPQTLFPVYHDSSPPVWSEIQHHTFQRCRTIPLPWYGTVDYERRVFCLPREEDVTVWCFIINETKWKMEKGDIAQQWDDGAHRS